MTHNTEIAIHRWPFQVTPYPSELQLPYRLLPIGTLVFLHLLRRLDHLNSCRCRGAYPAGRFIIHENLRDAGRDADGDADLPGKVIRAQ